MGTARFRETEDAGRIVSGGIHAAPSAPRGRRLFRIDGRVAPRGGRISGADAFSASGAQSGGPHQGTAPAEPAGKHEGVCARNPRSEEHTSELQSQSNLVCRLLL